jgi:DNA processing protein
MNGDTIFWVAFNRVPGIGPTRLQVLLDYFEGDLQAAWEATPHHYTVAGLDRRSIDALLQCRTKLNLEQEANLLARHDVTVLTWRDENYPRTLKEINNSPPVLYVRGELLPDDEWAVAIVGTRKLSPYGKQATEKITQGLVEANLTIVSGLALGVDRVAHQTALEMGGRTIAVLANGVEIPYPQTNRKLAESIVANGQGAIVSDYPIGTRPEATNFPPRNRIISGLSLATIITEAGERSGALITAQFALEQGREVMAVPGSIFSPMSRGTNDLISQGATPVLSASTVIRALNLEMAEPQKVVRQVLPETPQEGALLRHLSDEAKYIDDLIHLSNLPPKEVSLVLSMLELKGRVRNVGGNNWVRV